MPPPASPGDLKRSPITSVPKAGIPRVIEKPRGVKPVVFEATNLTSKKAEGLADANSSGVPDGGVEGRSKGPTGVAGGISPSQKTSTTDKMGGDGGRGAGHMRASNPGGGGDLQSKNSSSDGVETVAGTTGGAEDAPGILDAERKPAKRGREKMSGRDEAQVPTGQVQNVGYEMSSPREGDAPARAGRDGVSSEGGEARGSWDEGGRSAKRRKEGESDFHNGVLKEVGIPE